MIRYAILLLVLTSLGGCAAGLASRADTLGSSRKAITQATPCCEMYSEFNFEPISIPSDKKFDLDRSSPAFVFPSGKSFFRAFRLPTFNVPYTLEIESRFAGEGLTVHSMWMYYPVLMYLDEQYKPVKVIRDLPFQFTATWSERRYGMSAKVLVSESMKQVRYVVIYTEPDFVSRAYQFHARGTSGTGWIVNASSENSAALPFNYEGRVGISAYPYKPTP